MGNWEYKLLNHVPMIMRAIAFMYTPHYRYSIAVRAHITIRNTGTSELGTPYVSMYA